MFFRPIDLIKAGGEDGSLFVCYCRDLERECPTFLILDIMGGARSY
jgi:hypothetical protein